MTNEIRECANCEAIITEGYLAEWADTCYCSEACAVRDLGAEDVQEGKDDDTFFWTVWFMFDSITNVTDDYQIHKVYRLHDNIYFTDAHARVFQDGKDRLSAHWMVLAPRETLYEGEQADNYHLANSYRQATGLITDLSE